MGDRRGPDGPAPQPPGPAGAPSGPGPLSDDAAWLSRRRAVIRAHHPDRGGDPDVLRRELAALDAERTPRAAAVEVELVAPGRWQPASRLVARSRRRARTAARAVRASLPRGWPGRRTYHDL